MAKLTVNEASQGFTHKLAFDFNDLNATNWLQNLGAAGQRVIDTIAPGDIIDAVMLYQVTAAAGNTDATIDVGNQTNDPDEFLDADALGNIATAPASTTRAIRGRPTASISASSTTPRRTKRCIWRSTAPLPP